MNANNLKIAAVRPEDSIRRVFSRRLDYMTESIGGAIYGGLIYVTLVFLGVMLAAIFAFGGAQFGPPDLLYGLVILFVMLIGTVVFFGFAIMAASLLVNFVNWSFGFVITARQAIIVSGGLCGYLFGLLPVLFSDHPFTSAVTLSAFTPQHLVQLAFAVGALLVCSLSSAIHETRHTRRYYGLSCVEQKFRLSIQHLLAVTVWFAILMWFSTVLVGNYWPLVLTVLYFAIQLTYVLFDGWWQRGKKRRQERKAKAKTMAMT